VLDGAYGVNRVAIAIPKGKGWLALINELVVEAKASSAIALACADSGPRRRVIL
jgi:hypothetical protein